MLLIIVLLGLAIIASFVYSGYAKLNPAPLPVNKSIIGKYYTAGENSCAVVLSDNGGYRSIKDYDFSYVDSDIHGRSIVCKILTEPFIMHNYAKHTKDYYPYAHPTMVIVEDMKDHKAYAVMYDERGIIPEHMIDKYSEDGIHIQWWASTEHYFN